MRRRAILALLLGAGCGHWEPPYVEPVRIVDGRSCAPESRCVDVVVAIDTSVSGARPPAEQVAFFSRDILRSIYTDEFVAGPGSRLWIGLDGLEAALAELDSERVGIGVVGFAGTDHRPDDASWVEVGVTDDYDAVAAAVARIRTRPASGSNCNSCAVKRAAALMLDAPGGRCQMLVMLGDTDITLPYGPEAERDNERAIAKALLRFGIARSAFVATAQEDPEQVERLRSELSTAGGRLIGVSNRDEAARAIVEAVDSCD